MPARSVDISFASETLTLLADRAIHWAVRKTLILADVHLGKDASFRTAGLPVPAGNSAKDFARIDALLASTAATRLVVLGDLVHSRASHQTELAQAFSAWRTAHPELDILLIRGNHDRRAGPPPREWRIVQAEEPFEDLPLAYAHVSQPCDRPLLCGHIHPVVALRDFDRSFASAPCFVVDEKVMTLPAFGSFTGGFTVKREADRRIFTATGNTVALVR